IPFCPGLELKGICHVLAGISGQPDGKLICSALYKRYIHTIRIDDKIAKRLGSKLLGLIHRYWMERGTSAKKQISGADSPYQKDKQCSNKHLVQYIHDYPRSPFITRKLNCK